MIQTCEFFTVNPQFNKWGHCESVLITINEDCDYNDVIKELTKNGIFFAGCKVTAPASIIFDDAPNRCIAIGTEDDGTFFFSRNNVLHVDWIPDFIDVLTKVSDFINE